GGTVMRDSGSDGIVKKYFSFNGRLNRKPFLLRSVMATLMPLLLMFAMFLVFAGGIRPGIEYQYKDLMWLHVLLHCTLMVLAIISGLSLGIRRCHDLDKTGWWLLLGMIPCINMVWMIYLVCKRGTIGKNCYGEDPVQDDYINIEEIEDGLKNRRNGKGET
ncbi:MAG TPA: hypothetical protein DCS50_03030, partial [Acidaminococcaceae bacterium]|nr:hypothetical protein [Acidaminococcaceae bacterium]